jgi:hypothetical protein
MATFTDCADNLTCATLSGSNGIGVALAVGSPNKIVVSASNVPNSALANSSININGTTIALGASGSITVGGGTVTSVSAGTNLSASGTSTDPVLNLTGNITSGLTSITGLTNISSNAVTGTNISATDINTTTLTGSVSGTSGQFTNLTASHISSSTLTGSVSGASGQFTNLTASHISSSTLTGSVSGTNGQFGSATINTLNSTNISATTVSGAFSGSGALIDDITASHIYHFQEDVRSQFTAGTGISILLGQISVANVPNSSLANTGSTIGSTAVVLGTTVPSLTGLTNFSSTTITGTTGISSSLGTFTILTASNEKVLTSLSASQITASSISSSNYIGLTGSSANFPNFASDVRAQFTAGSNIGISAGGVISLSSSVTTTAVTGTTGISGALGLFTTLTGTNVTGATVQFTTLSASSGKILTSLSASQITASSISSSNYVGLSAITPVQYSNNVISLDGAAFTSSVGGAVAVATPLTKSGTTVGIQEASNTLVGVVNTGAQTFAGIKTFNSVITASGGITGSSTAQFTTVSGTFVSGSQLSGTNAKILTSLSASQITGSAISASTYYGLPGTVNAGNAGYVAYYASAGTTLDDMSGTFYIYTNGTNVGIGTTDVGAKLTILGGLSNDVTPEFRISGSNGKVDFYNSLDNNNYNEIVETGDKAIIFTEGTQDTGDFVIAPWVSTGTKGIRITSNGDVGIGVSAPSTTLHVNGNISGTYLAVSNTTTTTGQNQLYGKNIPKAWGKFKLSNPIVLADGYNFVTNRYNWITTGQKIAISASNFTTSAMVLSASIQAYITYENNLALVAGTANAVPRVISTTSNGSEGIITIDFINHTSSLLTMTSSPYSDAVPYLNVTIFTKM